MARERRGERERVVIEHLASLDCEARTPSNREIARAVGRHLSEVSRAIAKLERDERIVVEREHVNWRKITVC